jgi:hypothetical protein
MRFRRSLEEGGGGSDVGESGDSAEQALTTSGKCKLTRDQILSSTNADRKAAIARGFTWYDDEVPYSQSAWHESYRTDCSGFVSMCWELGASPTTAAFISGSSKWERLGDYEELEPADALVMRQNGAGHIVLFLGWDDSAHTKACVLEQASSASDMQFRVRPTSKLKGGGYKAIRSTSLPTGGSSTATDPDNGGGGTTPDPTPSGGGGTLCTSDAQCRDIDWCSKPMASGKNKGKKRCCTETDPAAECQ